MIPKFCHASSRKQRREKYGMVAPDESRDGLLSIGGVWLHLLSSSGWFAMERGSESVEPIDLIKAIYVVDIEHVAKYWDNWEGYERFVLNIRLGNGGQAEFLNRIQILTQQHFAARDSGSKSIRFGRLSPGLCEIALSAKKLAIERGESEFPSSRDFLYCICVSDPDLANSLQTSGLDLDRLKRDCHN
jgi:hypothetical protein